MLERLVWGTEEMDICVISLVKLSSKVTWKVVLDRHCSREREKNQNVMSYLAVFGNITRQAINQRKIEQF